MVIQYLDSHRISGLSSDTVPEPNIDLDFTEYADQMAFDAGWVSNNTTYLRGSPTNDNVDWNAVSSIGGRIYYDLTNVSNTSYIIRIKVSVSTITSSTNANQVGLLIGDTTGNYGTTNGFGIMFQTGNIGTKLRLAKYVGGTETLVDFTTSFTTGDYYLEFVRDGDTITVKLMNSTYTSTIESKSSTGFSGVTTEQYVKMGWSNPGTAGQLTGIFDNFKFWDGVTSVTSKPKIAVGLNGCKAYYNFEQTTGNLTNIATTANGFADGLGSSADGTPSGGVTQNAVGKVGSYGWSFDGVDDYVATTVQIPQTTSHTVLFWIKINSTLSTDTTYQFIMRASGSAGQYYSIFFRDNFLKCTKGDGTHTQLTAQSNFTVGSWYHCVITRDILTDDITFYLNGAPTTITDGITDVDTSTSLWIGGNFGGEGTPCTLDDLAIWNRALTSSEISNLYNAGSGRALNTQTNIETNSIFIETDTAKRWWYDGTNYQLQPTKQFDFSNSTGWVSSSLTYNKIDSGVLWGDWYRNTGGAQQIYYDLTSVSDTAWTLRFAYNMYSASTSNTHGFFGLSSTTNGWENAQDRLVFYPVGNPTTRTIEIIASDSQGGNSGDRIASSLNPTLNTWYYFDLVRDGATLKLKRYSDNTYSTVSETTTTSISGTVSNLRYLKFGGWYIGDSASNSLNYVDDVKFYNGVTSVTQ